MKRKVQFLGLMTAGLLLGQNVTAQVSGTHAFMIGDYVEIGINGNGFEGAPLDDAIPTHYRGLSGSLGFVANPAADGWVEYNGDFYLPGSPENGFGVTYTKGFATYSYANNAASPSEITGSITDFVETADSVIITWVGVTVDDLEMTVIYELQKDQHYYTTTISMDNLGVETLTDVYYYRNLDPDINQEIGWGFATTNSIVSQAGMADDSVKVVAMDDDIWEAEMIFNAYGPNWRGFVGGFANRDGAAMWNGDISLSVEEGFSSMGDQAMGIAYKVASIPPGRAASEVFSFATSFKDGINFSEGGETGSAGNELSATAFNIYPNPVIGDQMTVEIAGAFTYTLTDIKGSAVLNGQGNGLTHFDLSSLEKGVYFMQLNQADKTATTRVVIQ